MILFEEFRTKLGDLVKELTEENMLRYIMVFYEIKNYGKR